VADDGEAGEGDNVGADVETIGLLGAAPARCPGFEDDPRNHIVGTDGDDNLTGTDRDDVICGLGGHDILVGRDGDDVLLGGDGPDGMICGRESDGADVFDGGADRDFVDYRLRGTTGVSVSLDGVADDGEPGEGDNVVAAESIVGGDGDDVLSLAGCSCDGSLLGEGGADVYGGGPGLDAVSYVNKADGVTVANDDVANDGAGGAREGDDVRPDVEQALGTSARDVLIGSQTENLLVGGGGNDFLAGGLGDDTLLGNDGDDFFDAGATPDGADHYFDGTGIDTVSYSLREQPVDVDLSVPGGDGSRREDDNVFGEVEVIVGGRADDDLRSASAGQVLGGGPGGDLLVGRDGDDELSGGDGGDVLVANDGDDDLSGGTGDDTLERASGDDAMFGDSGNDTLEAGFERLMVGGAVAVGADVLSGGSGIDTVSYNSHTGGVTVTIDDVAGDGLPGEGDDVRTDVENLIGTDFDDVLGGSGSVNVITGDYGDDEISGGAGNDRFVSEPVPDGDDTLRGAPGIDLADHSARRGDGRPDSADLFLALGAETRVHLAGAVLSDRDHLGPGEDVEGIVGGDGDDELYDFRDFASELPGARLFGGPGSDTISGADLGDANDRLEGGAGNDRIRGLHGRDTIIGNAGTDALYGGTR